MRLCVKVVTPPQYPNLRQATPVPVSNWFSLATQAWAQA